MCMCMCMCLCLWHVHGHVHGHGHGHVRVQHVHVACGMWHVACACIPCGVGTCAVVMPSVASSIERSRKKTRIGSPISASSNNSMKLPCTVLKCGATGCVRPLVLG